MKKKSTLLPTENKVSKQPQDNVIRQILDYSKSTQIFIVKEKIVVFSLI